jgi:hypothetical protein
MAHKNQIEFIKRQLADIREPILIIGSKIYDYDAFDLAEELRKSGYNDITGMDISDGPGVDFVGDITDSSLAFFSHKQNHYNTIICMEVLTNVKNPFIAAFNVDIILGRGGLIILSECYVRKLSRMPVDYWRFTYDGLKQLFDGYFFKDEKACYSVLRQKDATLKIFEGSFEEIRNFERHKEESRFSWFARKLIFRFLSNGVFKISRLLPEQTIYAIGIKP